MRICYSVSPIGLGHASRSVALALELRKLGFEVKFFTGGNALDFLSSYGFVTQELHQKIPYFKVSKRGELKGITWWMISYIRFYKRTKERAREILSYEDCDLVLSDEDFAFAKIALEYGLETIFITDLIQTSFASGWIAKQIEKRTNRWFREFFQMVPMTIVPEEEGVKIGNMHYVGPIVRNLSRNPEEVRRELGLNGKVILVTSGGSRIGDFLFEKSYEANGYLKSKLKENVYMVFVGLGASRFEGENVVAFEKYRDLHELVAASDVVVSTAGKSTIDECRVYGKPCIAIPIKGHYEQERNAKKLGYSYSDLSRLETLILEQLTEPKILKCENNLERAIGLILDFLRKEHSSF